MKSILKHLNEKLNDGKLEQTQKFFNQIILVNRILCNFEVILSWNRFKDSCGKFFLSFLSVEVFY